MDPVIPAKQMEGRKIITARFPTPEQAFLPQIK
jgi:hypothetical protein